MKYYQIDIETTEEGIEAIVAGLLAIGVENTQVSDPADVADIMDKKESYEWDYINDEVVDQLNMKPRVTVYSEEEAEAKAVEEEIRKIAANCKAGLYGESADFGSMNVEIQVHDDSEWKDKWKEYFKPFRVGERILIKPTWEVLEDVKDSDILIEIDPGMAFGTGTHETTSMCIEMLEKYMKPGQRILDAGCGSGILSIAAAKLGAAEVLGVDIDEVAVDVAKENLALNHVEECARAEFGDVTQGVDYMADLVVANLMAELVCMITPGVPQHLTEHGLYITSGILVEKEAMVRAALEEAGFSIVSVETKGEWCCIAAQKGSRP